MNNIKNYTLSPIRSTLNQKGFSPVLILVLLGIGIFTGTILVQNGVSFLPRADEQEALNPSAGNTKNCANETDKAQCQNDNNVICAKDTVTYCDNRQGSPRAIRKSGGYYDLADPNTDASGCVFDYREVAGKDGECGKTESKSGDVVYTTKEEATKLDSDRAGTLASRQQQSSGTSDNKPDVACTDTATLQSFKDEKVSGNLVRFYAILAGMPEYCTPADLGVEPPLSAKSTTGQSGRLMLCSGKDGALTWRVISGTQLLLADKKAPGGAEEVKSELSQYINTATNRAAPAQAGTSQPAPAGNSCPGGVCP